MKIMVDKSNTRGYRNHVWRKSLYTFSSDAGSRNRFNFGALRMLNEDTVMPGRGFDMHPHCNTEVVSIPLQGTLRHGAAGSRESVITPGYVQVISTGHGLFHREYNGSDSEELRFLQLWVMPNVKNTPPEFNDYDIRPLLRPNRLACIIAPDGSAPASIRQNTWLSAGVFDAGTAFDYRIHRSCNGVYVFVLEGVVRVCGQPLSDRDGMGIWETGQVEVCAARDARLLLIEVPMA